MAYNKYVFKLPELPYSYNILEPFIDEETMHVHHNGHHAAYVQNLNEVLSGQDEFLNMAIEELLRSLDKVPEKIRAKVKNNAGGHYHHSIFWTMIGPASQQKEPQGKLIEAINSTFGNFTAFKEQFNKSAAAVFGSGWSWLVLENGRLKIINTPNQDSPISFGQAIILGIDLWEHAYYLKYKNKRAEWINNFWNIINWEEIKRRYSNSKKLLS